MKTERAAHYYGIDEQRLLRILFSGERNGEIPVEIETTRRSVRVVLWDIDPKEGKRLTILEFDGKTTLSMKGKKGHEILIHAKRLHELWKIFQEVGMGRGLYRETERSVWIWNENKPGVCLSFRIILDYWPGLEPLLSIEGCPEECRALAEDKLLLPNEFTGNMESLYKHMYGIDINQIEWLNAEYIESIKRLNYLI